MKEKKNGENQKSIQFGKKLVKEFEDKGFVSSYSNYYLLNKLREKYAQHFKIFDAGYKTSVGRLQKYGVYQVFGKKLIYFYDKRKENEFVDFLVNKFYTKNPDAGTDLQRSFTRILHNNGLCWPGCFFHNSILEIKKFKIKSSK